jgi:DNA-binding SARP family transcriptional activator
VQNSAIAVPYVPVTAHTAAPQVHLSLLDGFTLRCSGRAVRLAFMVQRLLAFLAMRGGPVRRMYVAGMLWMDTDERHANACLRSSIWRLRQPGYPLVETTDSHLRLAPTVHVDLPQARHLAHRLVDPTERLDVHAVDASLLSRELLPDWYDDWVLVERERFRQLRLHALEALCERLTQAGRFAEAIETGLAAVAGEPLRESAHRVLIKAHLAEGNRGEAIRQFDSLAALLRAELSVEPSAGLAQLVHEGCAR